MNKIPALLRNASTSLASSPTPQLDAELLLASVLHCSREHLASRDFVWTADHQQRFDGAVKRRRSGEPLAYIVQSKSFCDLTMEVNSSVLIPRPETEELVELAEDVLPSPPSLIADIGCGCANIALTLKHRHPHLDIVGADVSVYALRVAHRNVQHLGYDVRLLQGDLLQPLIEHQLSPSVIIANLPYLNPRFDHDASISFEPKAALFAPNGIAQMLRLLQQVDQLPTLPRSILFETDPRNPNHRVQHSAYVQTIKKDLAGRDRFIVLTKDDL